MNGRRPSSGTVSEHDASGGNDETGFLTTLQGIAHSGHTLAEDMLEAYHGHWNESVDPMFTEYAY